MLIIVNVMLTYVAHVAMHIYLQYKILIIHWTIHQIIFTDNLLCHLPCKHFYITLLSSYSYY